MSQRTLEVGSAVGPFLIDAVLGMGQSGITYSAHDGGSGIACVVKEFFPRAQATRGNDQSIVPLPDCNEDLQLGVQRFFRDASALMQTRHRNIVRVLGAIEANNTAYMAMAHETGDKLADALKQGFSPTPESLITIALSLLDAVQTLHRDGLIHRDVKENNVHLRSDGTPVLLDFGAARVGLLRRKLALGGAVRGDADYDNLDGNAGPWTDVHALAALLFRLASSMGRTGGSTCPPELAEALRFGIAAQQGTFASLTAEWRSRLEELARSHHVQWPLQVAEEATPATIESDSGSTLVEHGPSTPDAKAMVDAGSVEFAAAGAYLQGRDLREPLSVETAPVDAAQVETAQVETAQVETAQVETAQVETAQVETAQVETAQVETAQVETAQVETAQVEAAPVEAAQVEAAQVEAAQVEAAPVEAAPVEAAQVEAAQVEAAQVEAAQVEAAQVEAAQVEAAQVEAAQVEAAQVEAAQVEAAQVEAAQVEAAQVEAAQVEAAPVEAAQVEAAEVDLVRPSGHWIDVTDTAAGSEERPARFDAEALEPDRHPVLADLPDTDPGMAQVNAIATSRGDGRKSRRQRKKARLKEKAHLAAQERLRKSVDSTPNDGVVPVDAELDSGVATVPGARAQSRQLASLSGSEPPIRIADPGRQPDVAAERTPVAGPALEVSIDRQSLEGAVDFDVAPAPAVIVEPSALRKSGVFLAVASFVAIIGILGGLAWKRHQEDRARAHTVEQAAPAPAPSVAPAPVVSPAPAGTVPLEPMVASPPPIGSDAGEPAANGSVAQDPQTEARVAELLARAQTRMEALQLTTPVGENAYEDFNAVLQVQPQNDAARRGISDISSRYVELADGSMARGELVAARRYLELAEMVDPANASVAGRREELRNRRNAARSERSIDTIAESSVADGSTSDESGVIERVRDFLQPADGASAPVSRADEIRERLGGQ